MNGVNKRGFLRLGLVALVALLALGGASSPALAQNSPVTINPNGTVNSGVAMVTGTFTAPAGMTVRVKVLLQQFRHGQVAATAISSIYPIIANGSPQSWMVTLDPAIFVPGTAFKRGYAEATVKLIEVLPNDAFTLATVGATVRLNPN